MALSRELGIAEPAGGGRLLEVESPLSLCVQRQRVQPARNTSLACRNPYYIGDHPALTQSSGYLDAWTSSPSAYASPADETTDVVAAVNFARERSLRLVVKGGGHSYLGTSNAPDSLLIWTRRMNASSSTTRSSRRVAGRRASAGCHGRRGCYLDATSTRR